MKSKPVSRFMIGILICVLLAIPLIGACAEEEVALEFNYNCPLPPGGWSEEWAQKMCDGIYEVTDGQVTINLFIGGTLGPPPSQPELLQSGAIDLAYHAPPFSPGVFPLSEVVGLPFILTHPLDVAEFMYANYENWSEYDDYKVIAFLPTMPLSLTFRETKVTTVAELKGMKMRGIGGVYTATVEALGATPVAISTADLYMAMDTGIVDGMVSNWGYFPQVKMWEVMYGGTTNGINGGLHMVIMSKAAWDTIPEHLQSKIDEYLDQYWRDYQDFNIAEDARSIEQCRSNGMEIWTIDAAEFAKFPPLTEHLIDAWEKATNEKGLPGTETVQKAREHTTR